MFKSFVFCLGKCVISPLSIARLSQNFCITNVVDVFCEIDGVVIIKLEDEVSTDAEMDVLTGGIN